nr:probable endo-1,3(4)-beta-glucanase ARB_01444 [Ipomoea batatas]
MAEAVENSFTFRVTIRQESNPNYTRIGRRSDLRDMKSKVYRRRSIYKPSLVIAELKDVFCPKSPEKSPPRLWKSTEPFVFPETQSTVLPNPSNFFAPHLLSNPLPTNSFFQNFVLKNGDQPEYIHPYLIRSSQQALTLCYPSNFNSPSFTHQIFSSDLTITTLTKPQPDAHIISSFNDLSVTIDFPGNNLKFLLVRGCPFVTCSMDKKVELTLSTIHEILECCSQYNQTKHIIKLSNNQTWLLYASSPINLTHNTSTITSTSFSGIIRIALLPNPDPKSEAILHRFSACYPISGEAVFSRPFSVEYKWEKKGRGNLLMLAHPLHLKLLSDTDCTVSVLEALKYNSIDGDLVAVVGDSWVLRSDPISVTWHSVEGFSREESRAEIICALKRDVEALDSKAVINTSSYTYGKLIARAARLALIAEEVCCFDVIPVVQSFLKGSIEPWLNGSLEGNAFLYESKWGGIVTKQSSSDTGADFGFGIYNDHHYQIGYFIYAIAVLAKIDSGWGRKYKRQAYSLVGDYMNLGRREGSHYPKLRCFDLWKLHSWAAGLTESADGRNQESTSEAVNAYYAAALMGLVYGDPNLVAIGSTLSAMEILSAQTWWHVREDPENSVYTQEFRKNNRLVGVSWANKRDSSLWFAPPEWRECRVGIQVLPLLPISETLFSDIQFVKQLVQWTGPAMRRDGVEDGWKGFVYALEGVYDKEGALGKIRNLNGSDDGNSLTNLLWWIHSRDDVGEESDRARKLCWSRHYNH